MSSDPEITVPQLDISEEDMGIRVETREHVIDLSAFREQDEEGRTRDNVFASALIRDKSTGNVEFQEVEVPRRLSVAKDMTFDFVKRHKRTVEVIGGITVFLAAGVGIVVTRRRRS